MAQHPYVVLVALLTALTAGYFPCTHTIPYVTNNATCCFGPVQRFCYFTKFQPQQYEPGFCPRCRKVPSEGMATSPAQEGLATQPPDQGWSHGGGMTRVVRLWGAADHRQEEEIIRQEWSFAAVGCQSRMKVKEDIQEHNSGRYQGTCRAWDSIYEERIALASGFIAWIHPTDCRVGVMQRGPSKTRHKKSHKKKTLQRMGKGIKR